MRRVFGRFRRAGEVLVALVGFTLISFPFLVCSALLAVLVGIGVLSFLFVRTHETAATAFFVGLNALFVLLWLGKRGVLRADAHGDSLFYKLQSAAGDYKLRLRMLSDSRGNDRKAARWRRSSRRVLAALAADGPATAEALATRLGLATGALSEHLSHAVWRGWVEEVPAGVDGAVHYRLTGRGGQELAVPGSTDHEQL